MTQSLMDIRGLHVSYAGQKAVADFSLRVRPGQIVCLAGESGCGKSSVLRAVVGLYDIACQGSILFDGQELLSLTGRQRRQLLGRQIGLVPQNTSGSFNPIRSYEKQLKEIMQSLGLPYDRQMVLQSFRSLGLPDAEGILQSCPFEMSGGMNQRIAIAAAMLPSPRLLLCDEATSALDVTTQKLVADELLQIRARSGTAILLVTHNLGLARRLADMVGVMYAGRLVELGPARELFARPAHPYTRALLAAMPDLSGRLPQGLDGQPPLDGAMQSGCAFAPRCAFCDGKCQTQAHAWLKLSRDHYASCRRGTDDTSAAD